MRSPPAATPARRTEDPRARRGRSSPTPSASRSGSTAETRVGVVSMSERCAQFSQTHRGTATPPWPMGLMAVGRPARWPARPTPSKRIWRPGLRRRPRSRDPAAVGAIAVVHDRARPLPGRAVEPDPARGRGLRARHSRARRARAAARLVSLAASRAGHRQPARVRSTYIIRAMVRRHGMIPGCPRCAAGSSANSPDFRERATTAAAEHEVDLSRGARRRTTAAGTTAGRTRRQASRGACLRGCTAAEQRPPDRRMGQADGPAVRECPHRATVCDRRHTR